MNEMKKFKLYVKIIGKEVEVKEVEAKPEGEFYSALCPFHNDKVSSLKIYPKTGTYHCYGCEKTGSLIEDVSDWLDKDGNLFCKEIKLWKKDGEDKIFIPCVPLENGRMLKGLQGKEKILYNLPEVLKAQRVFIVEGTKDANTLNALGQVATTNIGGAASKWKGEYSLCLKDKDVIIIPDNDTVGLKHGKEVALSLTGIAKRVRLINLPDIKEKGDITDWLDMGKTIQELGMLVEETPEWNDPSVFEGVSTLTESLSGDDVLLKYKLTDPGNAETFHSLYKGNYTFVRQKKTWFKFDGIRWVESEEDVKLKMVEAMREKEIVALSSIKGIDEVSLAKRQHITKWCLSSESANKVRDALYFATSYFSKNHNEFDKDPWLLTCKNGVIDLTTGKLRQALPEDMLQRSTNITFNDQAKCPRWEQFLREIFLEDENYIKYIQKAIGYTLTGLTKEQCLFILWGAGANGKSTFLSILKAILGSYSMTSSFSTFKEKKFDEGIPNDIARISGARLVISTEMKESSPLNEERIKTLTGEDDIQARFLRQEFFEFKPSAKFWFGVNHQPTIRGTDYAIWRRIKLIPFDVTFPEEKQDKNLKEKLLNEVPGVLNWAIQGCLKYQKEGLKDCERVKKATAIYRKDMDIIARFLEERIAIDKTSKIRASDLYNNYKEWCQINGEFTLNNTKFGRRIVEKGISKEKSTYVTYRGIRLIT